MRVFALAAADETPTASRDGRRQGALAVEIHWDHLGLAAGQELSPDDIKLANVDDEKAKKSASRGAWKAFSILRDLELVHPKSDIPTKGITFDLESDAFITGSSAGLAFLVATAAMIIEDYLRLEERVVPEVSVVATGQVTSISDRELVENVSALRDKLEAGARVLGSSGYLFYPSASGVDAPKSPIDHVAVATPRDAIDRLLEIYELSPPRPKDRPWRKHVILAAAAAAILVGLGVFTLYPAEPCGIETALFREGASGAPEPVSSSSVLHNEDQIKLRLRLNRECFVYVLSIDPNLQAAKLYPREAVDRPLAKGEQWIPETGWFGLTEARGAERIIAIGAQERIDWLENAVARLKANGPSDAAQRSAMSRDLEHQLIRNLDSGHLVFETITFQHE